MPGGISLITNFDVQGQFPIDSRMVVSNLTTRDNLAMNIRYEGLRVYVLSEKQSYVWQDATWRVEYNGIYGGSGSLPGNVTVDFGTFSNNVGSQSYYFEYESGLDNKQSFLQNQFIRHTTSSAPNDEWRGVEFRQQMKYHDSSTPASKKNSAYISFNPSLSGSTNQNPGGLAFGTGYLVNNIPITERMRITSDGRVGIGTNDPKEFLQIGSNSSTQIPFVIHNGSNSAIASNWYYTTADQYFSQTRGSARIQFENGVIHFSTRNPNVSSAVLNEAMRIKDKKVGIGTTTPNEFLQIGMSSSTQLPLVFHNEGDAAIGYNWYWTGSNTFNNITKGSGRIKFGGDTGEILFSTRNPNAGFFNSTMILKDSKVGVNNTNPSYALDVTGDIRSNDKIRTTNGYYFENAPVTLTGGPFFTYNAFRIEIGPQEAFSSISNSSNSFNLLSFRTIVNDVNLVIYNSSQNNGILSRGLVFGNDNNIATNVTLVRPGIFQYQDNFTTNSHGISILSTTGSFTRESLRISEGGKRIQMGVISSATGNHTFTDSTGTFVQSNSLIDTRSNMFTNYNFSNRPNINILHNLLHSGQYIEDNQDIDGNEFRLIQNWTRIGKVINVQFRIEKLYDSGGLRSGAFRLYREFSSPTSYRYEVVNLPIEINNWTDISVNGVCHAFIEPYGPNNGSGSYATQLTIDVGPPSLPGGGLYSATTLGCLRFQRISGLNLNRSPNNTFVGNNDPSEDWYFRRIYGSYTITINI